MYTKIDDAMDYAAALYIRLSKEDDHEKESESVTNQRSLLQAFAREQGLAVCGVYVDDGYSGTSFDRPGFLRLIADIEARKVNMVLTKDMSRLGRDYIQTGYYLEKFFPLHGVRYISLLDGVDTGADSGANDVTPFKAVMNDMYAKDISKKITSVKRDKQRKGQFIGGKAAYGYKLSQTHKNTIEIDPPAAGIVRRMFRLAAAGASCREIAALLNREGLPTPAQYAGLTPPKQGAYSGQWSAERITFMLKNEVYIGNMVQGRTRKINHKLKKCQKLPPSEWTVVAGTHEPIVDADTFRLVQRMIRSRAGTRRRTHDFLLKGLVFCLECGRPLGVLPRTLADGRQVLYFVCRTYQRGTRARQCTCHCVRVEAVTAAVTAKIRAVCQQHLDRDRCRALVEAVFRRPQTDTAQEIRQTEARMTGLTRRLDQVYGDKLSGTLGGEDFRRIYDSMQKERTALQEKLKSLQNQPQKGSASNFAPEPLIEKFLTTADTNRALFTNLIARIDVSEQKEVVVKFRCRE
ncbi:MAG: recombinase family protein [Oscillospiraceae bacterium]|jgi:DNA invertase Pin-like site-specific DNA recombinase|nr:recombinase family protein [Oscillospiraceae bacterium]